MLNHNLAAAIGSMIASLLTGSLGAAERPPNIVFVIADDCTFRDIGCYGGQAHTPNIDRFASEGMRFTHCFQTAPMCSPTRHTIYTGQYPVKTGAYPNHTRLDEGVDSIVQYLGPLGYRVVHSGKSHVAPDSVFHWEHLGSGNNPDFVLVDKVVGECVSREQPFCLLLCSNEPHTPWNKGDASRYPPDKVQLPPYLLDTAETRMGLSNYLAEITYFDSQVGHALKLIDDHSIAENTLVMVVSEQGSSMPFAKWTCYDNGLQSACIARWPGRIESGSVNPAMIEYVDFLPTWIEAAGGRPASEIDGMSLMDVFAGKQQHKEFVYGEMTTRGINNGSPYFGIRSVRSRQFKYIWNFTPEIEFRNACTQSPEFRSWVTAAESGDQEARELVDRYRHRPEIELYDVLNDPFEMTNLVEDPEHAPTAEMLRQKLDAWMEYCGDRGQSTELDAKSHQKRGGEKRSGKRKPANRGNLSVDPSNPT